MDIGFYIIILFLILLKLMIWVCVFYSRAQRRRALLTQRGIIIIPGDSQVIRGQAGTTRDQDFIITNEHIPGYPGYPGGVDNPNMTFAPPSYEQVQHDKTMEEKPPSYDQVVTGSQFLSSDGTTVPSNDAATQQTNPAQ